MVPASFLVSLLICAFPIESYDADHVVLDTKLGQIRGIEHSVEGVYAFYGIPYGVAPVGDLRFRPAQLNSSMWQGVFDGTEFGSVCMMLDLLVPFFGNQSMSENCLYLNVWTPSNFSSSSDGLPVMLFINGGGFVVGAGSEYSYNGLRLVSSTRDFVYVSINYRLGAFGFLQNAQLATEDANWPSYGGQNGVHDSVVALQWVQRFISSFGGDPNRVTIFGQSAGGLSVCNLVVSATAKGLFQRAIIESGACTAGWSALNASYGLSEWNAYLKAAGYDAQNLTALREVDAFELNDALKLDETKIWQGSVDGVVLTDVPRNLYAADALAKGTFNPKNLVIGFNSMDGVSGFPWHLGPRPTTQAQYSAFLDGYVGNATQSAALQTTYYPPTDFAPYPFPEHNSFELAWFTIQADCCLSCSTLSMAHNIGEAVGENAVFVYYFGGPGKNGSYYAPHASELPFVFDIPEENHAFDMPWDQQLSDEMVSAWTGFARDGMPNVDTKKVSMAWTAYGESENVMSFRDTIEMKSGFAGNYRRNVCEYWRNEVGLEVMTSICNSKRSLDTQ